MTVFQPPWPIERVESCAASGRQKTTDSASRRTVLVVDDDATARVVIRAALESDGWTVQEASDGIRACEAVERVQPDIIVMDVSMPNLDGFEACARLRALGSGRHIPVMMITGMDDPESVRRAYEVGATDFLSKPVHFMILQQRLQHMHRAHQDARDLRSERDFVSAVVNHSSALVMVLDPTGRIVRFNESCERASGLSWRGAQGERVWDLLSPPKDRDHERITFERLIDERGTHHYEGHWTTDGGSSREIAWSNSVLLNDDGEVEHVVCIGLDITEWNQAEEHARFLASYDPLTGLPNRRLVTEHLEETIATTAAGQRLAVGILDLDRFKDVNASWGRAAGDKLLRDAADRLARSLRLSDVLAHHDHSLRMQLGRVGADEFSVIVPGVRDATTVALLVERMQQALARPFKIQDQELTVTASVGAALYPVDGTDAETILRNAEAAKHAARDTLRGSCHFYSVAMHTGVSESLALENELRHAVDRSELVLHYQEKTLADSGRICGAEALVRWHHPSRGLLAPASFIGMAEETGLIVPLGEWVLRETCHQVARWLEAGHRAVPVAVNLSSVQSHGTDLLDRIATILTETALDPAYLVVEITESLIMRDVAKARETLRDLSAFGVQVAIDDFGTGHATLSLLKDLPVHQLKIDRTFVGDLTHNAKAAAITKAIIAMAHGLGLTVIAEGVSSEEQLEILRKEGCDQVQGWLVGEPVPSDPFLVLLDRQADHGALSR